MTRRDDLIEKLSDEMDPEGARAFVDEVIAESRGEPPLLMCVDCKNTESPAGAMARQFNHGRCVHCGGYFKVVRA